MKSSHTRLAILISGLCFGAPAFAASTDVGTISVEGENEEAGAGLLIPEEAPKQRSTVTRPYIKDQRSTENPYQLIKLLPGVNSYSDDPTGLFGGSITVRGFSGDQMGATLDGVPLNDSGNFALYPQEYVDAENLQESFITQGSADVDAPHVGAVGGNLGLVTINPQDRFGIRLAETLGGHALSRTYMRLDSGRLPTGTQAFISYSKSWAHKWRGAGYADRNHIDAKLLQHLGRSQFSVGFNYNENLNHFFRRATLADFNTQGRDFDYATVWKPRPTPVRGTAQDESLAPFNNTAYFNLARNPFRNYIVDVNGNIQLTSNLRLDIMPYFWYGFGGGTFASIQSESVLKRDLNGDGDQLDKVLYYGDSTTKTERPGIWVKLNYQLANNKFILGYWYERARHRQTQPFTAVDNFGNPVDPWGQSNPVNQGRNWLTLSTGTEAFVQDHIRLMNDKLSILAGVRTPRLIRNGTEYAKVVGNAPVVNTIQKSYSEVLPQAGLKFQFTPEYSVFFNYAKNFRAPQNYTLFEAKRNEDLKAETADSFDLGMRMQSKYLLGSATLYAVNAYNRLVQTISPVDQVTLINTNVGAVHTRGLELELGTQPYNGWSIYSSLTYNSSILQENFPTYINKKPVSLPVAGKTLPDAPRVMTALALQYQRERLYGGVQAKYTSKRYATLTNDQSVGDFTTVDMNLGYRMPRLFGLKEVKTQLNLTNLFDKGYLSSIYSTNNASGAGARQPTYQIGSPFFASVTLSSAF